MIGPLMFHIGIIAENKIGSVCKTLAIRPLVTDFTKRVINQDERNTRTKELKELYYTYRHLLECSFAEWLSEYNKNFCFVNQLEIESAYTFPNLKTVCLPIVFQFICIGFTYKYSI